MSPSKPPVPTSMVTSDASRSWEAGVVEPFVTTNNGSSLHGLMRQQPITLKELAPLVIVLGIWGAQWRSQVVRCLCDNAAVVSILHSRISRNKEVMHLLRCLYFYEAHFECKLAAEHIPGTEQMIYLETGYPLFFFYRKCPWPHGRPHKFPPP